LSLREFVLEEARRHERLLRSLVEMKAKVDLALSLAHDLDAEIVNAQT
jgi:hypothetical protein